MFRVVDWRCTWIPTTWGCFSAWWQTLPTGAILLCGPLWPVSSSLASGIHTLRLQINGYDGTGLDGILIYGGTITAAQNPSVMAYPSGISLMDGNMTNTNFPVIVAASVTPAFVVSGTDQGGVNYWISYNGAPETAYVPGTAITTQAITVFGRRPGLLSGVVIPPFRRSGYWVAPTSTCRRPRPPH